MSNTALHTWAGTLGIVGAAAFAGLAYFVASEDDTVRAEFAAAISQVSQHTHAEVKNNFDTRLGLLEMNQTRVMNKATATTAMLEQLSNSGDISRLGLSDLAHKLEAVDRLLYEVTTKMLDKDVMLEIVSEISVELLELRMRIEDLEKTNEQSNRGRTSDPTRSGGDSTDSTSIASVGGG